VKDHRPKRLPVQPRWETAVLYEAENEEGEGQAST